MCIYVIVDVYLFGYGTLTTHSPLYIKTKSTIFTNTLTDRTRTYSLPWIIERLDWKLADVIRSNIEEKYDVTLWRAIQPFTSDVLRVLFFLVYFTISVFNFTDCPCFDLKG